jgi:anaerobic magnesium-protoporphyrin IX monomethyl ester cyclase
MPVDFIVHGEGEVTFRELTRALDGRCDMHFISGLSHRCGNRWIYNQQRAPHGWKMTRFVFQTAVREC